MMRLHISLRACHIFAIIMHLALLLFSISLVWAQVSRHGRAILNQTKEYSFSSIPSTGVYTPVTTSSDAHYYSVNIITTHASIRSVSSCDGQLHTVQTKESLRCFTFNVAAYESDLSVEEESPLSLVIRINKTSES